MTLNNVLFFDLLLLHCLKNCSWDGDFLKSPEKHRDGGTVHIPVVIDLKMFDIEVNRTQVVYAALLSAILKCSIKQTKQGRYQEFLLSL